MREKDYWILWNQFYLTIGPVKFYQMLKMFGNAKKAWEAPKRKFLDLGWNQNALEKLDERENIVVTTILDDIIRYKTNVIMAEENGYPARLKAIDTPPPILYVRGELKEEDNLALGVVGSRRITSYGREVTDNLVYELASSGLSIVSGLALGIDAQAHKTALKAGGRTIAVLASGLDTVSPASNVSLAKEIVERGQGAIVSEFPFGTPPYRTHFPFRNRVISGMSLGTLVIEAAQNSGTFHTVRAALDQGREVFAVPGSIFSIYSRGTAQLIKDGAHPVICAKDILDVLDVGVLDYVKEKGSILPASDQEEKILEVLGADELHLDEVIRKSGLDTSLVLSTLTIMEMRGIVKNLGASTYRAVR